MKVRLKKCVIEGEVDHIAYRIHKLRRLSSLWVTNMVPYRKIKAEIISDLIERQTIIITSLPLSVSWPSYAIKYVF